MKQKMVVIVERKDGSTFEQEIEVQEGETYKSALGRYKKMLGKDYCISDWYFSC